MKKISIGFIVGFHLSWLIMLLVSLPLVVFVPRFSIPVLVIVAVTLLAQLVFWGCPLTIAEHKLRGPHAYPEKTFLSHYLKAWFDVRLSDRAVDVGTACYLVTLILVSVFRI